MLSSEDFMTSWRKYLHSSHETKQITAPCNSNEDMEVTGTSSQ